MSSTNKRTINEMESTSNKSDSTTPLTDSQAKKQRYNTTIASCEEIQEVATPPREVTTEGMYHTSLTAEEKTPQRTTVENNSLDEFSLQLITDEEELYDAEYEEVLYDIFFCPNILILNDSF